MNGACCSAEGRQDLLHRSVVGIRPAGVARALVETERDVRQRELDAELRRELGGVPQVLDLVAGAAAQFVVPVEQLAGLQLEHRGRREAAAQDIDEGAVVGRCRTVQQGFDLARTASVTTTYTSRDCLDQRIMADAGREAEPPRQPVAAARTKGVGRTVVRAGAPVQPGPADDGFGLADDDRQGLRHQPPQSASAPQCQQDDRDHELQESPFQPARQQVDQARSRRGAGRRSEQWRREPDDTGVRVEQAERKRRIALFRELAVGQRSSVAEQSDLAAAAGDADKRVSVGTG